MAESVWITWENQRRNRELSEALGVRLFEFAEIDEIRNVLVKYAKGAAKTLRVLFRERPTLIYCQNPSIVLAFLIVLAKPFNKAFVCVDAHNVGLFPREGRSAVLSAVARFIQRRADLTLVTNEALRRHVEGNGGRAFVLPDRIPRIETGESLRLEGTTNILFICSYAADEPYEIVFQAAEKIDPGVFIYVTGNYRKRGIRPEDLPGNVVLTGFLPEEEYCRMLGSVDGTIDLTTRRNCLVCGAYESVAVGKPMILSDTAALREYFSMGAVYTRHTAEAMAQAIEDHVARRGELSDEVRRLKDLREAEWEARRRELQERLLQPREGRAIR